MKKVVIIKLLLIISVSSIAQPFLSGVHEFYLSTGYNSSLAGIRNNAGHPVLNSKEGGTLYLNRDVSGTTRIQSKNGVSSFSIASFMPTGLVGIGTETPRDQLEVKGNNLRITDSSDDNLWNKLVTNSDGSFSIKNQVSHQLFTIKNGFVGIGTDSPNESLVVEGGNSNSYLMLHVNGGGYSTGIKMFGGGIDVWDITYDDSTNKLNINEDGTNYMTFQTGGNIGIGTTTPQSKLSVDGQIRATEVKVLTDISVPDYVFEPDYKLRTLKETKKYIIENKHLPEIPSASEIGENGIDIGDMNMRLLKKIEELTLYQIELMEKLEQQNAELQNVKKELQTLKD